MRREPNIPLFLWVTAAIVAHAVGGGGATEIVKGIEETFDIGSFASEVRYKAKFAGKPIEVSWLEESPEDKAVDDEDDTPPEADSEDAEKSDQSVDDAQSVKPDALAKVEKEIEPDKKLKETEEAPKEKEKKPEDKVADLQLDKQKAQMAPPANDRRVAVVQHVKDKNQEDNPNARFAADQANRVDKETQARITSTDQNAEEPTVGKSFAGEKPDPGNANDSRVAQSDESPGDPNQAAGETSDGQDQEARAADAGQEARAAQVAAGAAARSAASPAPPAGQSAQEARAAQEAEDAMAETIASPNGSFSIARAREARAAQSAQRAQAARPRLPQLRSGKSDPLLGYGSMGTTSNGVNLNINPQIARSIVTEERVADLRKRDGERRLSQHRGSWTTVGLERWKPALENYVASVQPGNQTALNTAAQPFASYLNQIHQRLHDIFAHGFLGHLDQLPADHPLNNQEMSTFMEIALNHQDGQIVKLGITKSSGVTAFDVGALESVKKAAPYGVPPGSIVSSDGNVYLHWEFHRKPEYACSTYFARPYIIDLGQKSAPPRIEPREKPPSEDPAPPKRRGSLEKKQPGEQNPSPS